MSTLAFMDAFHLKKVISGGQTGIDQMGLEVARSLGISTGGIAPKGYLTGNGPDQRLRTYGLIEHSSAKYPARTRANVQHADGTVLFGSITGGTKLTLEVCKKEGKPFVINPTTEALRAWLLDNQIRVLNVAGSRGSGLSSEQIEQYRHVLADALKAFVGSVG